MEKDFSVNNYQKIIKTIKYKTIFYDECRSNENFTLWRHDVDFSVHRAYVLAKIEKEEEIRATYFFQLGSIFYNIFEQNIKDQILDIKKLGHKIGLHFDPTQYDIKTKEDLEKHLLFEKRILESLFSIKIDVFSFHNPTLEILKYDNWEYSNMINTYSTYFKENVDYCSDSNGYWRHKRLEDFLAVNYQKIQVLTHPAWWQKSVMLPRSRIQRCIDGRSKYISNTYDKLLSEYKRENIGK